MKLFVPIADDDLAAPGGAEALVPYRPGLPLASQFAVTLTAREKALSPDAAEARRRDARPAPPLYPR